MARITVEDCLEKVESRFSLAVLAAKRAKMLVRGARPLVDTDNKHVVNALREIAAEKVSYSCGPEGEVAMEEGPQVKLVEGDEEEIKESQES